MACLSSIWLSYTRLFHRSFLKEDILKMILQGGTL